MEHQRCCAAARSSEETQRRREPREPAAEASAASAPGRHDGQRRRLQRTPRVARRVPGPDRRGPTGHQQTPHRHRGRARRQTLTEGLIQGGNCH